MIGAREDAGPDGRTAELARAARVPVNIVDRPELCDFTTPSIVERGDMVIGISTGGAAPVLGRAVRARIESLLPARLGALAAFAAEFRSAVKAKIAPAARRAFWERVLSGPIAEEVLAGRENAAREAMLAEVNSESPADVRREGVVHIVGAGPGDPELLTLKALRLLQEADVILHDRLVDPAIIDLARRDADRIYVGKAKSRHSMPQEEIATLMISLAREGKKWCG